MVMINSLILILVTKAIMTIRGTDDRRHECVDIPTHRGHILNGGEVNSLSVTQFEEVGAEWGWDAESKSVDDNEGGESAEDEHPEPEEDVDLLIEDVDRQDAERVVLLQLPGGAKLVKSALCQPSFDGDYYWLAPWTRTRRVTWERCRPLGQFCPPGLDRQKIKPDQLWVDQLKNGCYILHNGPNASHFSFFLILKNILVHQVLHFIFCDLNCFLPRKYICRSSMLGLFLRV